MKKMKGERMPTMMYRFLRNSGNNRNKNVKPW